MTLKKTLEDFIKSRMMAGLVEKSIKNYIEFCGMFIDYVGSDKEYNLLKQDDIDGYILCLMSRAVSKTTIATYIRHMKIYLKWCNENYDSCLYDYKKIKVPRSPKKNVLIYSDDEIKEIYGALNLGSEWLTIRNKAIVSLMLDSGFRQAEVTRVKLKDIDFKRKVINVHGKGDKDRLVPLGNVSATYIKRYLLICPYKMNLTSYVFMNKDSTLISTNAIKLMVYSLSKRLPFELSSHKLRHNFATNYCLNQYRKYGHIDIYQLMYLLGHEDVKTTSRYLHFAYEFIATERSISHVDIVFSAT